jgi:hypothetical protein
MKPIERGAELLRQTETELRSLVSESAATGDYSGVFQLAAWARAIAEIIRRSDSLVQLLSLEGAQSKPRAAVRETSSANTARVRDSNGSPQFFRHADRLIRVSWSKREKKQYEHRAPFAVLMTLGGAITEKGADGRIFTIDDLLPLRDENDTEVPVYQVYVGISLLRQHDLIDQHGRRGYSVPQPSELLPTLRRVWESLPEK